MVGASSSLGSYYTASFEVGGARRGRHWRSTVVLPREQRTVMACGLLMLHLRRDRFTMRLAGEILIPVADTHEEFTRFFSDQIAKWAKILKRSGSPAD